MKNLKALNIYQINIFQILLFMYKLKNNLVPKIFHKHFEKVQHKYPTKYSIHNYIQPKTITKMTNFSVSSRGPLLWNNLLDTKTKTIDNISTFKYTIKKQLQLYCLSGRNNS